MSTATKIKEDETLIELIDEQTLDQLRSENPKAYYTLVEGDDGPVAVVFRRMTDGEVKRASAMEKDKFRRDKVASTVSKDIVLYPSGDALAELREVCPLMDDQIAALAFEIARGKAPEEAKKLLASSSVRAKATPPSTGTALGTSSEAERRPRRKPDGCWSVESARFWIKPS